MFTKYIFENLNRNQFLFFVVLVIPILHHIYSDISQYVGETSVRIGTRAYEHANTDINSAVFKHLNGAKHKADNSNFKILARGYSKCRDRKIAEALYIKDIQPNLNKQVKSHKLELFV